MSNNSYTTNPRETNKLRILRLCLKKENKCNKYGVWGIFTVNILKKAPYVKMLVMMSNIKLFKKNILGEIAPVHGCPRSEKPLREKMPKNGSGNFFYISILELKSSIFGGGEKLVDFFTSFDI